MGYSRSSASDWDSYSSDRGISSTTHVDEIYTSSKIHPDLDPKNIEVRESRDSEINPNSVPIIIGLDVTGSMDKVLSYMAKKGLRDTVEYLYDRKPVTDPHIMCMGIGDVHAGDRAPLQVTQFESNISLAEQLQEIYFERRGGGNSFEGYALAWYFAANHTSIDSMIKRNKKGYLFTVGDEEPTPNLTSAHIERIFGYKPQFDDISAEELLDMVRRNYEVYHVVVEEGFNYRYDPESVNSKWTNLLGQRVLHVSDITKLGEVIASTLQIANGESVDDVVNSWDGSTSVVVQKAVEGLTKSDGSSETGVVKF